MTLKVLCGGSEGTNERIHRKQTKHNQKNGNVPQRGAGNTSKERDRPMDVEADMAPTKMLKKRRTYRKNRYKLNPNPYNMHYPTPNSFCMQ